DENAAVFPGAVEICGNNLDDDCSGIVDDAGTGDVTYYTDKDGDGFPGTTPSSSCTAPPGSFTSLAAGADCDDSDVSRSPGATEVWYDGVDQNCDGNDSDQDGDGFDAVSAGGTDCEDTMSSVNPGVVEVCNNGVDDDCDGGAGPCAMVGDVDAGELETDVLGEVGTLSLGADFADGGPSFAITSRDEVYVVRSYDFVSYLSETGGARLAFPSAFDLSGPVAFGDINGDGHRDVLVAGYSQGWWIEGPLTEAFYGRELFLPLLELSLTTPIDSTVLGIDEQNSGWLAMEAPRSGLPQLRYFDFAEGMVPASSGLTVGSAGPIDGLVMREGVASAAIVHRDGGLTEWSLPGLTPTVLPWEGVVNRLVPVMDAGSHLQAQAMGVAWTDVTSAPIRMFSIVSVDLPEVGTAHLNVSASTTEVTFLSATTCDFDNNGTAEWMVGFVVPSASRPWDRVDYGVAVFEGIGSGGERTLEDPDYVLTGAGAESVVCVDLDEDGRQELVTSDEWVGFTQVMQGVAL
ncbi:MAG: hypothetical protein ACJAV2_000139, partial [Myxococcota bacterium]